MTETITITTEGRSWAVKHGGDFLGFTRTREDAVKAARELAAWISTGGRNAEVVEEEPRSFAPLSGG